MGGQGLQLLLVFAAEVREPLKQLGSGGIDGILVQTCGKTLLQFLLGCVRPDGQLLQKQAAVAEQPAGFLVVFRLGQIGGVIRVIQHDQVQGLFRPLPGIDQDACPAQLAVQPEETVQHRLLPDRNLGPEYAAHGHNDLVIPHVVGVLVQIHADIRNGIAQGAAGIVAEHLHGAHMKFVLAFQPVKEHVKVGHIQTLIHIDQKTKAILHKESPFFVLLTG